MNFIKWLIKTYINDDTPYGDLARDVNEDIEKNKLTQLTNYTALKNRIILLDGNTDVLNTLDEVYKKYKSIYRR